MSMIEKVNRSCKQSGSREILLDPVLKLPEVLRATALCKTSLYEMIKNDEFPSPIKLGRRAVGWKQSTIIDWIDSRPTTK